MNEISSDGYFLGFKVVCIHGEIGGGLGDIISRRSEI